MKRQHAYPDEPPSIGEQVAQIVAFCVAGTIGALVFFGLMVTLILGGPA